MRICRLIFFLYTINTDDITQRLNQHSNYDLSIMSTIFGAPSAVISIDYDLMHVHKTAGRWDVRSKESFFTSIQRYVICFFLCVVLYGNYGHLCFAVMRFNIFI